MKLDGVRVDISSVFDFKSIRFDILEVVSFEFLTFFDLFWLCYSFGLFVDEVSQNVSGFFNISDFISKMFDYV